MLGNARNGSSTLTNKNCRSKREGQEEEEEDGRELSAEVLIIHTWKDGRTSSDYKNGRNIL